jgi:hypothetical protein
MSGEKESSYLRETSSKNCVNGRHHFGETKIVSSCNIWSRIRSAHLGTRPALTEWGMGRVTYNQRAAESHSMFGELCRGERGNGQWRGQAPKCRPGSQQQQQGKQDAESAT